MKKIVGEDHQDQAASYPFAQEKLNPKRRHISVCVDDFDEMTVKIYKAFDKLLAKISGALEHKDFTP